MERGEGRFEIEGKETQHEGGGKRYENTGTQNE